MDKQTLEALADTYFQNLTPQEASGWEYTGICYFDIEKDLVVGEFAYLGEPRTKEVAPALIIASQQTN